MVNQKEHPEEFEDLMHELKKAKMYIENLLEEMNSKSFKGEAYYKAQVTNIYSCINKAWNSRNDTLEFSVDIAKSFEFPKDIP